MKARSSVRKSAEPQIVEVEPETNMDGVSVMDARRYFHFCPDRARQEEAFRAKEKHAR